MTYAQAIDIALMRTDSEKSDYDEKAFASIADAAQKKIAMYGKHIKRTQTIEKTEESETEYTLNSDFYQLYNIEFRGSIEPVEFYIYSNKIVINGKGTIDINYYAMSQTIDENTADDYEFEVSPETHNAIPYYIGYELTKTDDVTVAQLCLNEWNRYMALFEDTPKITKKKIINHYGLR